jgi:hypothetical protein
MANNTTTITEDDVKRIGGTFVRHVIFNVDKIEGDEYLTSNNELYLVNIKRITSNT